MASKQNLFLKFQQASEIPNGESVAKCAATLVSSNEKIGATYHCTLCVQIPENFRKFSDAHHMSL